MYGGPIDFERELDADQYRAVTHGDGPQLVIAGAGSGKTRVITYRVAWLARERGVRPEEIVAVTFTNKAAAEMRERVERLLGLYPLPTFVGTFHRFALTLLRRHGDRVGLSRDFAIFDRDDQISLVKKAMEQEGLAESSFAPRSVLAAISRAKNHLVGPDRYEGQACSFFERKVAGAYRLYQGMLVKASGLDFDDMLRLTVKLLRGEPDLRERLHRRIRHLLVDEFQDTNHAQLEMVRLIVGAAGNLTAVGDEDQGIYRWRGADLENVLEFEKSFPGAVVRKLERNYRSTQHILSAANGLVRHNTRRRGKRLWTDVGEGEKPELYHARDEQDEARWVVETLRGLQASHPLRETAVLVRTNAQTRSLEEELLRRQVPYELVGGVRFYERAEIKDLVAYLRLIRNPQDNLSLLRVLNKPPRGIGAATRKLVEEASAGYGYSLWDTLCQAEPGSFPSRGANALAGFRELIEELRADAATLSLPSLLERVLEATGYAKLYDKEDAESQARLENIREFVTAATELAEKIEAGEGTDQLTAFLDHASLVTDVDEWRHEGGVSLMTLHSAKGLEFEVVVVAGLEDGLLPHFNAGAEPDDVEEERRLLYVGMTRAKRRLFLTTCRRRRIAGRYQDREQSPFLLEIPAELLEVSRSPDLFYGRESSSVYSFFDRRRPEVDPDDLDPGELLRRGARVRHPTLGEGQILETHGAGEEMKLVVFFPRAGKRKLAAKYASLEVL